MADLTAMVVQGGLDMTKPQGTLADNLKAGIGVAQQIQEIGQNREKMEQAKQTLHMQKIDKVMDAIEKGSNFKDKSAQNMFFKNYVPSMVKALKLEDFFSPDVMNFMQSPEVRDKLIGLRLDIQNKINNGELEGAAIMDYAKSKLDPEELAMLDTDTLLEQQKFAASEEGKSFRSKLVADAAGQRQRTEIASTGEKEVQKQVGKEWADYQAGGGKAAMDASVKSLEEVLDALQTGKVQTGGISTVVPGFKSEDVQIMLNPAMVEQKAKAQQALNTVLRATLGAQFTAQEGERVLNQVWSDKAAPEVNARKVGSKLKELKQNIKNKESTFKKMGFAAQSAPSISPQKKEIFRSASAQEQETILQKLSEQTGQSVKELKKLMED